MAGVISALYSMFCDKLASEAFKQFARFKQINTDDVEKLKRSLIQIKDLLNDASQKEISEEAVKEWLNNLQHLAYEIDDLLDELATEAMHREFTEESGSGATPSKKRKTFPILSGITNLPVSARMRDKLENITTKLQELLEEKEKLGLGVIGESPKPRNRRYETSLIDASSVVGRTDDKDALLLKLYEPCDTNYSIVPIFGMGGVGKTTLARLLYNEEKVKDHFELMAWVCVSDEFDIFNISKIILQSVGGGNPKSEDLNLLQVDLEEKIRDKRFLLVLDDVWSESYTDWEILQRPFLAGAPGSKVIMTTRKLLLLNQLGQDQPYSLRVLARDNALTLFCQHALGKDNFDSHLQLFPHGKGIVEKCDGLPLALIALGRLLRTNRDEEEWKEVLNSEIWNLGNSDKIVPALRLSYHDLSACLKRLFTYCSLFPKDYEFDKHKLILLWMAEGLLQSTTDKSMERLGIEYFDELWSRSFLQQAPNDKSLFVMHDLMNDLATSVAGDFFSRLDIGMKKEYRNEALQKYRHMSFVCERYMVYERFKAFKGAINLRTFLALSVGVKDRWIRFHLPNKLLVDLLHELPLLRVLSLSYLNISEAPEVIGSLKHLRYLNISQTEITHLPENVCNLYNLQTLILFGCKSLTKLPDSFLKLKNLRHLDIGDTPRLKKMPLGIGDLKSLQTLSKIIIGDENGFTMTKLENLQNLHGEVSILGLGTVQNAMDARKANLSQKRLSELQLDWGYKVNVVREGTHDKEVLDELNPDNDALRKLKIKSYGGMEFPKWVGDPSFRKLTRVSIYDCEECTSLPKLGLLPELKDLFISKMSKVKFVDWDSPGTGLAFPSLEILSFSHMSGWEVWSTNSGVVGRAFPRLQELRLIYCPNLVEVSLAAIPSLKLLKVSGCGYGLLTSLVHVASSVTKLEIDDISGLTVEVWRGVMEYLGEVEEVRISRCNEIKYLWGSEGEASNTLVNLRMLEVHGCSNLVSLGEKEEDNIGNNLTSLRQLQVQDCSSLEHCNCPDSIETLSIHSCDSITSVSFPTRGGQKLKSLNITHCKKLLEKELGGGEKNRVTINNTSMPMLQHVQISNLPNLKSIINWTNFDHLTALVILGCPSMDASFPCGLWPPKLIFLAIGGLKKPISEWGPQNFPTSLVDLHLYGIPSEDISNFIELSHLFPSSLIRLRIYNFEKLESLLGGLDHLTSLQHLTISDCPKTLYLPESVLPSLLSLYIDECPNLKEKISRGDSHLPLIYTRTNKFNVKVMV